MDMDGLIALIERKSVGFERAVIALSGGVDSGLAAYAAHAALGERAVAVTVESELTPRRDRRRAEAVAGHIGIDFRVVEMNILQDCLVRANAPDRCYHCKRTIFQTLSETFRNGALFMDGTNADDDPQRPGLRAIREFNVFSPLYEAGLTKSVVRSLSRSAGVPNWNAPSESCLATRIPNGVELSSDALNKVEAMESFFHDQGVDTLRVKYDNLVAIVEYLPQYADIMEKVGDKFVAFAQGIGVRSCDFKEWTE